MNPLVRSLLRLAAVAMLSVSLPALAASFTFKIATLSPEGSSWMETMRAGAARIEEETQGRVKFRFYPGGIMGDDTAMLRKMRIGQIHGAALTGGALTEVSSDVQLYSLPLIFRGFDEVEHVRAALDGELKATLEQNGHVVFGIAGGGFAYAMSQNRADTIAEIRKAKVWAPEGDQAAVAALDAFGIKPIPLTLADVLAGLQTGLIDAVAAPPIGALVLQWYTQVDYLMDLPLMYVYGMLTVVDKAFDRISPADQATVRRVMAEAFDRIEAVNRADHENALEALLNQGLERLPVAAAARAEFMNGADGAIDSMIRAGVVERASVERVRALLKDYRAGRGTGATAAAASE